MKDSTSSQGLPAAYQSAAELEALLCKVFQSSQGPAPTLRLKFQIEPLGACVLVGGGLAKVLSGSAALQAKSDLTFVLTPQAAHRMWNGPFRPLAELSSGGLKLIGSPLTALRLGGLEEVQRAYQAVVAEEAGGLP